MFYPTNYEKIQESLPSQSTRLHSQIVSFSDAKLEVFRASVLPANIMRIKYQGNTIKAPYNQISYYAATQQLVHSPTSHNIYQLKIQYKEQICVRNNQYSYPTQTSSYQLIKKSSSWTQQLASKNAIVQYYQIMASPFHPHGSITIYKQLPYN